MYSFNKTGENMMLKMKKKNYVQERKNNLNLDEEINNIITGGAFNPQVERLWRGKTESFKYKTNQEKNFYIKEVMKKFQTNQDEWKGYNYKYILELSDLLGGKDKDFSKKRLELYNHRIEREKKKYSKSHKKFIKYQTVYKPKKQTNYFMEFFDNKKNNHFIQNHKGIILNTFTNTLYNNNEKKEYRNREEEKLYSKTTYNYNPIDKMEKLKNLLNDKPNKKYNERKYNNIMTEINNKKDDKEEQSFDTTSLVGKEDFLVSGDKEKYHEYLSREYNFFNQAKLRQMKYIFDKQKRIKLFKKLPNAKFLNYKQENPLKLELFNKINREKEKLSNEFPYSVDKRLYLKSKTKSQKNKNKTKFNEECQIILNKLKKKFDIK